MNANMLEMSVLLQRLGLMMLIYSLLWDEEDDEEERPVFNLIMNKTQQLNNNLLTYIPSESGYKNFARSGTFKTLDDIVTVTVAGINAIRGKDMKIDGSDRGTHSQFWKETKDMFLPGVFKDLDPRTLGLGSQMEKQFSPDPFKQLFESSRKQERRKVREDFMLLVEKIMLDKPKLSQYVAEKIARKRLKKRYKDTKDPKTAIKKKKKQQTFGEPKW